MKEYKAVLKNGSSVITVLAHDSQDAKIKATQALDCHGHARWMADGQVVVVAQIVEDAQAGNKAAQKYLALLCTPPTATLEQFEDALPVEQFAV